MAQSKYKLEIDDPETTYHEYKLIGAADLQINWEPNEDGWILYDKEVSPEMIFSGEAFQYLYLNIETQEEVRCTPLGIIVSMLCEGAWQILFTGTISMEDGNWDIANCTVTIPVLIDSDKTCIDNNEDTPVDLMSLISTRVDVELIGEGITFETVEHVQTMGTESGDYWPGSFDPLSVGWRAYYTRRQSVRSGRNRYYNTTTRWARERLVTGCAGLGPSGWMLIIDNCLHPDPLQRKRTWVRAPTIIDCFHEWEGGGTTWWRKECTVVGMPGSGGDALFLKNGMLFKDVLERLVQSACPFLTVRSDFFQINPDVVTSINYVTGQLSKVNHLIVFQNSDINYPQSSQGATKAITTLGKFMNALRYMFNVRFTIESNVLIIEHVSRYEADFGLDLTQPRYSKHLTKVMNYSYAKDNAPKQETWTWSDGATDGDFKGLPIVYNSSCGSTGADKTYAIDGVNTNVVFAIDRRDDSLLDNDGLTIVATEYSPTLDEYFILSENGILGEIAINNSLSTSHLLRDYHKYDRPFKTGVMNGQQTTFISVAPNKQGEPISIPFCCGDAFNPEDRITTPLGTGIVSKATFNFKTGMLDLDILY